MSDSTLFSPSDLIYLFLDKESTSVQNSVLFTALVNNTELQNEFLDAVNLNRTAEQETRRLLPSPMLTSRLFSKIGISLTLAKASSVLSFTKAGFTSLLLLALGVGAIVGYFLHIPSYNSMHLPDTALHISMPNTKGDAQRGIEQNIHESDYSSQTQNKVYTVDAYNSGSVHLHYPELVVLPLEFSGSFLPDIPPTMGIHPLGEAVVKNSLLASGSANEQSNDLFTAELTQQKSPSSAALAFSASLRGITGIGLYNNRSGNIATTQQLNNFAISIQYSLADEQHIGIEAGQEMLPSIVVNPDGSEREKSTIEWLGVTYRYTPYSLRPDSDVRPFGQIGLGGSTFGPTLKTIVGFEWQPSANIGLMFGTEGSVFAYRYSSTWYYTQKLGLTGGLVMRF